MMHGGVERTYELRLPPSRTGAPLPLVLSLHGLSQSPRPLEGHRSWLPMDPVADREGFAIAYPEAIGGRWSYWPGTGVPLPNGAEVDDVAFVAALLESLVAEGLADPRRLYAVGISRGAVLAWVLGCRLSDRLAAIAPLSSGAREPPLAGCTPTTPPAVMAVAGNADPVQPYDGWLDPPRSAVCSPCLRPWSCGGVCMAARARPSRPCRIVNVPIRRASPASAGRVARVDYPSCSTALPAAVTSRPPSRRTARPSGHASVAVPATWRPPRTSGASSSLSCCRPAEPATHPLQRQAPQCPCGIALVAR